MMRLITVLLIALGMAPPAPPLPAAASTQEQPAPFDFVFIISIDGLRSDAIPGGGPRRLPNLHRLLSGSSTLNARTDPEFTLTLPNHTAMISGRPVGGPDGHGWTENGDPAPGKTLQSNRGMEIDTVFGVAHRHGLSTGLFFTKAKFSLWITSFNTGRAAQDMAISRAAMCGSSAQVTDEAIAVLAQWKRGILFLHYAQTDLVGHADGWDLTPDSPYMSAVAEVDAELGRLLSAIGGDEARRGRCAIILTTDHGGGYPHTSHVAPHMWVNYIIPFLVWVGDDAPGGELYEINAAVRRDPSLGRPDWAAADDAEGQRLQPIRNGDAANLALGLLGLPPVPGSTINARQDLRVLTAGE